MKPQVMLTSLERDAAFRQLFRWRLQQFKNGHPVSPKALADGLTVEGMRRIPGTDSWYYPEKTYLCRALILFRKLSHDMRLRKIKQLWSTLEPQQLHK